GASHIADEWPLAHRVAEHVGITDHVPVRPCELTPMGGLLRGRAVNPHEPIWTSGTAYWLVALLDAARRRQLGVLLTGQHGNFVSSWPGGTGAVWAPLLAGRFGAAWRALADARQRHETSLARAVERTLVAPLRRRFFAPGPLDDGCVFPIHRRFAERLDLRGRFRAAAARRAGALFDPRRERCLSLMPGADTSGALWQLWGAEFDLDLRHPTMDQRLIELCFAIPEHQFAGPMADR